MSTTDWRFTCDGEPHYYADNEQTQEAGLASQEMPGYRPGTVAGSITASDLWQLLIATKFWLQRSDPELEEMGFDYDYEDYLWKVEAETNFLYSNPDRDGDWAILDQRIVSGSFAVVDELNYMGFAACFSNDKLHTLSIEVDTSWWHILQYDEPTGKPVLIPVQ